MYTCCHYKLCLILSSVERQKKEGPGSSNTIRIAVLIRDGGRQLLGPHDGIAELPHTVLQQQQQ